MPFKDPAIAWRQGGAPTSSTTRRAARPVQESIRSLRPGGRLIGMGSHPGPRAEIDLYSLYRHEIDFRGAHTGNLREVPEVLALLAAGTVRPVVDSVFPLAEAAAAQERLVSPDRFGKVVLSIG
ncbi:NADPH:quinone reductase-like Zn-dependent oxidoreductase [Amycolatopsis bartoniae]|uniref:Zinc-binding dehydrogenase n=1 Tax=Amycolatopsis bartoniae TaxID=941986 RepID=A0A8H9J3P8_9PSEU|nr:zinc-binding dehydrogenase [Amycolatopsis bartoniae]MBB2939411.1 NADPH:quinone reductase-like Zn-dependent oxidoreductase [Amycolatopsis bartoniae]TVT00967.1 zinc-binding dehydrogenase [Amycolatopsis bartoniae]GHF83202.1 hypothetical protein GCM10017566_66550 [Amycolatopsis bartoniae]